ncbi:Tetratricopeptide repeat (TPR)-like superfamily protein [Raphanus sativus]|uniref:Protein SLOW GREEN 1, chloroplastic n=1 Tax=Raphanus sativus TaxID=3726 RepID=A0A6J0LGW6_RAPSA|nr:protein SLOW GREEN 1, chloroplastic [Raphanus sativus]KAJ4898709.1 Tetratricopeptide repeat (TPR)-like superfamily protein [Raphanus sativus]
MSSIGVYALSSPAKFHRRREKAQTFTPTHFPNPNGFPSPWRKSRPFSPKLSQSLNFASPSSHLPLIRSSPSPPSSKGFLQTLARKAAVLLVGSFVLLLGFSSSKPALALPTASTASSQSEEEEMFEKVLEREPENMEAMKAVLYKKMRRGKTEDAVKYVEKLIKLEPREVEWKLLEALCYETMGQLSKAKRLFKDILKDNPLLIRALHGLAMVMHKSHDDSSVFDMLNEAMEVARRGNRVTEERNIQVLIGQMHIVKGQFEESLKIFQEMVNDNPRDFRPYLCQGIVYSLMDRKEEADQQFEIYWSLVPEEFPQKGFLDDVALAAQAKSRERLQNTFKAKFTHGK